MENGVKKEKEAAQVLPCPQCLPDHSRALFMRVFLYSEVC